MALIEINGSPIVDPVEIQWDMDDLDSENSGRNQEATMFRDRIASKRKLICSWGPLREGPMSELLTAVEDASFTLEYPDAKTGTKRTGEFMVGTRSAPMCRAIDDDHWLWEGLSMNFIEM